MSQELKLSDSVWHRVVQCIQEGILTGTDVSDSLRQIRVVLDESDGSTLVLAPSYKKQVGEMHEKMLQRAEELRLKQLEKQLLIGGDGEPN